MPRQIVISGAAGGIGRALCPMLSGADLLLIDRAEAGIEDYAKDIGAKSVAAAPISADDCRDTLDQIEGPIHGFAHFAGVFTPDPVLGHDENNWTSSIQNNLENAYNFATALADRLPEYGPARWVFVSSLAFRQGSGDHTAYTVAKGGIVGLTRSLARRFAPQATVNAVAPGIIETPMPAHIIASRGNLLKANNPMGRFGQPEEVASVIRFLLSDEASYINGQTINVHGGHSMT